MKKIISLLLVLCLVTALMCGCSSEKAPAQESDQTAEDVEAAETPVMPVVALDYEAIRALYEPETVVMTADGKDISWEEYYSWLYLNSKQMERYLLSLAMTYNLEAQWDDAVNDDPENTYAAATLRAVEESFRQFVTIEAVAENNNITAESVQARLDELRESDIVTICGEGATEEDLVEYLESIGMSKASYERTNLDNLLYQQIFIELYGQNCEKVSDKDAMAYLEGYGYMSANHILFMTVDSQTQAPLEESLIAEKRQQAEALLSELQATKDTEELLELFKEKKQELCEDRGKTVYPDGYLFTSGEMVPEFENGVLALEEYGISDIIESSYGFHIIMRLPLNADTIISYSDSGTPLNARSLWANENYGQLMQSYADGVEISYAEDFVKPDLTSFVVE